MIEYSDLASGYSVSRLINGCWQLSTGHQTGGIDHGSVLQSLRKLVEAGLRTFDCADIYVGVEELLGELGAGHAGLQVHTKFVPDRSALKSLTRQDVEKGIDRSLRHLGVEQLDLVQFHWWDYAIPGYLETAGWLAEQLATGKIRLLGVTNFDTPRLREMVEAGVPIVSNQIQYSLLDRRSESGMVELCREMGIRLLCYGAIAGGFLSARWVGQPEPIGLLANRSLIKYKLIIEEFGGWTRFQELLSTLARIARRHRVSVTNVALRWVLDRPGVAAVVVGASSAKHLADNLRTFDLRFGGEDEIQLAEVLDRAEGPQGEPFELERVIGGRHATIMMTDLNRDTET